ncbi:hypothetical protein, partial [Arsenophonus sp. ENCA]|uniref:hypothetical protein n=1 Tax=Arsenophonus sp. ENCA TaxID=1987579 RepID=UPI0025BBDA19
AMAYNLSRAVALILWMIFSLLFVQTKIRKRENLHGGILLKKKFHPFCDSLLGGGSAEIRSCYPTLCLQLKSSLLIIVVMKFQLASQVRCWYVVLKS